MNLLTRLFPQKATLPVPLQIPERQDGAFTTPMARPSWQLTSLGFVNPFARIPQQQNLALYEQMVQLVPVINAALARITQLVGCPRATSDDQTAVDDLNEWWENVRVNRVQTGGSNLFASWLIAHLTYGRAHVEIIPTRRLTDLYALQLLHTRTIDLRPRADQYGVDIVQFGHSTGIPVILNRDLVLTAVHDIRDDSPQGNSLLYGLPFVTEIFNKMVSALKETWERHGVPTFFVNWVPPDQGFSDPQGVKGNAIVQEILAQLQTALKHRANGKASDFGAAGKVTVSILGAEGEVLDIEVPGRMMLEQIVAKTGLPSWMLGMHWSTTERMSSEEAKLLSTQIDQVREHIAGELRYLFDLRQRFVGRPFDYTLEWEAPSLIDQMATAQAEKVEAEGLVATIKANRELWTLGAITEIEFVRRVRTDVEGKTDGEIRAMLPLLLATPPAPVMMGFGAGRNQEEDEPPSGENRPVGRSLAYGGRWGQGNGRHG